MLRHSGMMIGLLLMGIGGCGVSTYPVEGVVQFEDGRAASELAGGFVSFQGLDQEVSAQGEIRSDGTFVLSTLAEGDGAYPGRYRVMITPPPYAGPETQRAPQLMDPTFSDPAKTPLEITVEARRNALTIPVGRFKQRSTLSQ